MIEKIVIINYINANIVYLWAMSKSPLCPLGFVNDCNKAIALDSTDKNAYFMRGLGYYGLGKKQKGCDDFKISIDLGFDI